MPQQQPQQRQHTPIHVLVVEDDAVSRDVAHQMLAHFGYRVTTVDSGQAALAAIRSTHHDLVLMDCRMIDMDGLETTRRLRAGEAGPQGRTVPIVALTAQGFAADREACLDAGMNDFLTKPVSVHSLIPTVENWARSAGDAAPRERAVAPLPTHMPITTAPPVFDPTVLASLPMVADGSQPGYSDVVLGLYFESALPLLDTIRRAAAGNDTHTAQRAAHTLKSSSAAVGALSLSACAADVEAHLRAGHLNMSHLPALLEEEFARLCDTLGRSERPGPTPESAKQPC